MVHHGELEVRDHGLCVCSLSATAEREIIPGAMEKPNYNDLGYDTKLKSNVEINKEKTNVLRDENIITVAPNVSASRKCCSSRTVPIYESYTPHHDILRLDLVGRDPVECSMKNLTEQQYSLCAAAEREIVREINEKTCYIFEDYDRAQIDRGMFTEGEDQRACKRKHHPCRQ